VFRRLLVVLVAAVAAALPAPAALAAPASANSSAYTYAGTWYGSAPEQWSKTGGATATAPFTVAAGGGTVSWTGFRAPNHGRGAVSVDGGPETTVDLYRSSRLNTTVWTSANLAAGQHTMRVRVVASKSTQASDSWVSITGLTVSNGSIGSAAAPPPPTSGSGAPVGNLAGWRQTYAENFNTSATSSTLTSTYPRVFPYQDNPQYARANLSVGNGSLNFNLRGDGKGAAVVIRSRDASGWGQTYGRYSVRFRADNVNGFGAAFMLWPDSEVWGDGETDFPEGGFGDQIHAYNHCLGSRAAQNCLVVNTGASWTQWHVATIDWTPTAMTFYLDGNQVGRDTSAVASRARHWLLQTSGSGGSRAGALQIDWVALYERA